MIYTQRQIEISMKEMEKSKARGSFKHAIQMNKHVTSVIQKKINKKAIYLARYSKYD
jgi:hypothetical protein